MIFIGIKIMHVRKHPVLKAKNPSPNQIVFLQDIKTFSFTPNTEYFQMLQEHTEHVELLQ